jgi:hypothetical protein
MAEAAVSHTALYKGIRWYDGFVVALANPGFLIGSLGYSIGALGGWGAVLLWTICDPGQNYHRWHRVLPGQAVGAFRGSCDALLQGRAMAAPVWSARENPAANKKT